MRRFGYRWGFTERRRSERRGGGSVVRNCNVGVYSSSKREFPVGARGVSGYTPAWFAVGGAIYSPLPFTYEGNLLYHALRFDRQHRWQQ